MTAQEYYALFSEAMSKKQIVRYENSTSRDDYHTYAIRETSVGHIFFCLLETFFRTGKNLDGWMRGSLKSYHQFHSIKGATTDTLRLTAEIYVPKQDYRQNLPMLLDGEVSWITID